MPDVFASPADAAICTAMLRAGSKSFAAASMILPARVRQPATALYAFCRLADDAVDLAGDGPQALMHLNERLARAYAGDPLPQPVDRAFADVVARFNIPRALPEALFDGFAWDAQGQIYESLADVEAYAVRVAGTVGMMMALIMGVRAPTSLARACDLGIAMQLTNIARDVGEDARAGRLYLPRQWLRAAGIDPKAFLRNPVFSPALQIVVARLLEAAAGYYRRAGSGIAGLPLDCRPAIHAARLIYAEIGRDIAQAGHDSMSRRAYVTKSRKCALLGQAFVAALLPARTNIHAVLVPSARFLVEAVAKAPVQAPTLDDRIARTIDLFSRVDRRPAVRRGRLDIGRQMIKTMATAE